ncbi:hypothetical protein MGYG_02659 [Nannizzia gypsea CBS 118893]|uniref:Uncharacterized protein n=1 Tax=Arthroderma gypseum (strain ATCC MYA-4604 / CBS 118893) TaxID=535722 RepID=E4UNP3_ARTGP|nr:hypothetical protein MGYG_02659 [Nannizzia gypsea CBS 118893]EFQ99646.1 hypothetical protein MGYG_02659 [Nannizzia gypsea CBS 118893]
MIPRGGERHRASALPGGAYGIDPRSMSSSDVGIALQQAQQGVQGFDFGDHSNMRHHLDPTTPFTAFNPQQERQPGHGAGHRGVSHHLGNGFMQNSNIGQNDPALAELVRRTNLAVSLANHNINPRSQFTQVHPMMCFDGRFPTDFRSPKTVESVKLLDVTQLDRILHEYQLPYDTRSIINSTNSNLLRDSRDMISSSRLRQAKLQILFEHLGASRIVEQERQKRL